MHHMNKEGLLQNDMQEKLKRSFLKAKNTKDKNGFYSDSLKVFISTLNEQQLQAMCSGYVNNWVKQQEQQSNPADVADDESNEHDKTFESLGDET